MSVHIHTAHIHQCKTINMLLHTDKIPQSSHKEYAKFASILCTWFESISGTCKLFQRQFSPFYSKLWPVKDAFCKGSLKAPLYMVLKQKISEIPAFLLLPFNLMTLL